MKRNIIKVVLFIIAFGFIFFTFFYFLLDGLNFIKDQFGEDTAFIALLFFAIVTYIIIKMRAK
jgi:hypothetical protein